MNGIGAGPLMHLGRSQTLLGTPRFPLRALELSDYFFCCEDDTKPEAITCVIGIRSVKVFSDENGKFNTNK